MRRMAPSLPGHSSLKPPLSRRRSRLSVAFLGVLALGGCSGGVLDPKGPIGASDSLIMINSLEIMLAIVIPTIIAALLMAWWYRSSNRRAFYRPDWAFSGRLELIVWSIPILVILLLSGVIWIGSHELDPAEPIQSAGKPIEVQVVSMDWKWLFMYPEQGVASVNDLVVPVGVPIHFSLTSSTVMNSFFVPQLGSMIATIPLISASVVFLVFIAVIVWVIVKGHFPYLWREWITSVDHKRIGVMYIILALVMLLRGFIDAIMMRSQQALAFQSAG